MEESLQVGSEVLRLDISDLDMDSELKLYIVAGDPDLQFAVDDLVCGVVYLRRPLDRETRDLYELSILASDSKYTATTRVLVHVLDVNGEFFRYCMTSYLGTLWTCFVGFFRGSRQTYMYFTI